MIRQRLSILSGHWLDRMLSLACMILAIGVIVVASSYPDSAASVPIILGWMLVPCAVGLWLFPGKPSDTQDVVATRLIRAVATLLLALLLFSTIGADAGVWVLFVGCAWLMGHALNFKLVGTALLFVIVLGGLFSGLLGVPLDGPLFGLFLS